MTRTRTAGLAIVLGVGAVLGNALPANAYQGDGVDPNYSRCVTSSRTLSTVEFHDDYGSYLGKVEHRNRPQPPGPVPSTDCGASWARVTRAENHRMWSVGEDLDIVQGQVVRTGSQETLYSCYINTKTYPVPTQCHTRQLNGVDSAAVVWVRARGHGFFRGYNPSPWPWNQWAPTYEKAYKY